MAINTGHAPIKILMVDDNRGDYGLVRTMLAEIEDSPFTLEWVDSYDAGLPLMISRDFDVILVDYHIGERNGLELVQQVKQQGGTAPMIMLTGLKDEEFGVQAVKCGAADYLVKSEINSVLLERSIRYAIERKGVEERLRLLESVAVHANDAILITEAEPIDFPGPRILYVNEAFTRMTGYSPEEVLGQSPRILQGPKSDRAGLDKIRAALSKWESVEVELINYHKDGREFWVELSIVPVADQTGWYTHWVSVQRDITSRKQTQEALQQAKEEAERAREEAERASRAKSEFLSRMSHELRTPLNAILGFGQLLEMDTLTEEQEDSIGQILKAGHHLLDLINEVLDISRIEAGRLSLSLEVVSINNVILESVSLLEPLARRFHVKFDVASLSQCSSCVFADRQRLQQVILNLFSNAIKYNCEHGWVYLECKEIADRLRMRVRDTGPGIAPDKLERLFIPFDRLDIEKTGIEGTGIGLVLAKRLVEAMGGSLTAESVLGQGTTFTVELPLAENAAPSMPQADPSLSDEVVKADAASQWTILYIEDNLSNLNLLERILARRPHIQLLSAMQGRIGVELAHEHRPDLILLDMHLPDINGDEVLRLLQQNPVTRDIPVIMVSADATPGQIQRLREAGVSEYLTKPLDVRRFLQIVDESFRDKTVAVI